MRIPPSPPTWNDITDVIPTAALLSNLHSETMASYVKSLNRKYVHWHKFQYYKDLPFELSPAVAWQAVKASRISQSEDLNLRFDDENFRVWTPPHQIEMLHLIDKQGGGNIGSSSRFGLESQDRERYLVNSLMEEAIASSQLEGAATTRARAKTMLRENQKPKDRWEKMIVNNYLAIRRVKDLKDEKLSIGMLKELHKILTAETFDDEGDVARLRSSEDEIRVVDVYGEVLFTPPAASSVEDRLKEICAFANQKQTFIHPVIKAIVLHFMIGFVHPFVDGNGRTARAIFYWYMLKNDYWLFEFLPISKIYLNGPSKYARAYLYTETDNGDLTYFVNYNLKVICRAISDFLEYLEKQQVLVTQAISLVIANPNINRRQADLLIHSLRHPGKAYTISLYRQGSGVSNGTARSDLLSLCKLGFLKKIKRGKVHFYVPEEGLSEKLNQIHEIEEITPKVNDEILNIKEELYQLQLFDT